MKFLKIYIIALLLFILSIGCNAQDEKYVRVGLSFGSNAVSKSTFTFEKGFRAGYLSDDNTFSPVMFFASNSIYATRGENGAFKLFDSTNNGCIFEAEAGKSLAICPIGDSLNTSYTAYSGTKYPYYINLTPNSDGSHNVINVVETEQYIKGVLPGEVYPSWHEEALKAAAVATRTFTYNSIGGKHKSYGVDLCKTTCCQVYTGISKCAASTNKATDDTKGLVLLYNDKLITAVYHAISGGITESAAGAWGSDPKLYPYLTVIETPFEQYEKLGNGVWKKFITTGELANLISASSYRNRISTDIRSITVNDSTPGYLNNMTITDTSGNSITLTTSSQVRSFFSKYAISANFVISPAYIPSSNTEGAPVLSADGERTTSDGGTVFYLTSEGKKSSAGVTKGYYIDGKGFGHGVGMSQYGSQYAAKEGYTYDEILAIYYPGTTLTIYDK